MHQNKRFYIIWSEGGLLQTWAWAEDPELVWAHLEVIIGTEFENRNNLYIEEFRTLVDAFEKYGEEALSYWYFDDEPDVPELPSAELLVHPRREIREIAIAHLRDSQGPGSSIPGMTT